MNHAPSSGPECQRHKRNATMSVRWHEFSKKRQCDPSSTYGGVFVSFLLSGNANCCGKQLDKSSTRESSQPCRNRLDCLPTRAHLTSLRGRASIIPASAQQSHLQRFHINSVQTICTLNSTSAGGYLEAYPLGYTPPRSHPCD